MAVSTRCKPVSNLSESPVTADKTRSRAYAGEGARGGDDDVAEVEGRYEEEDGTGVVDPPVLL